MFSNDTLILKLTDESGEEYTLTEEQLKNSFANCLKELRCYKGYTLKQVAEGTGIPIATVQRYESGENTPSVVQAFKFSYFYEMDINDMFLAGHIDEYGREKIFEERISKR